MGVHLSFRAGVRFAVDAASADTSTYRSPYLADDNAAVFPHAHEYE